MNTHATAVTSPKADIEIAHSAAVLKTALALLVPAFIVAFTLTATVTQAAGWSPTQDISTPGLSSVFSQLAVSPQGSAVAIWVNIDDFNSFSVRASTTTIGEPWSKPVTLTKPDTIIVSWPDIAIDPQGKAIAIWSVQRDWDNSDVQTSTLQPGGTWSEPVDLTHGGGNSWADIAMDGQGNAVAVWERLYAGIYHVQAATLTSDGTWSEPENISAGSSGSGLDPQVAVNSRGNATAIWSGHAATLPAGGSWGEPVIMPVGGRERIAVDDNNNAVVVGSAGSKARASKRFSLSGPWSEPVDISKRAYGEWGGIYMPQVALDRRGNAMAVWNRRTESGKAVEYARSRTGETSWSDAVAISTPGRYASFPAFGMGPKGNAAVIWYREFGSRYIVQASTAPASGDWTSPVDISPPSIIEVAGSNFFPQVKMDSHDRALAIWPHAYSHWMFPTIQSSVQP